jgi:hypothetical protein
MKKIYQAVVTGLVLAIFVGCGSDSSSVLEVSNTGTDVVDLQTELPGIKTVRLGESGRRTFALPAKVQMGNAEVRVGEKIEVSPISADVVSVRYTKAGRNWTMMLSEGGTGYFDKSTSFAIGDATFRVVRRRTR